MKHLALIVSGGRTGTAFCGKHLAQIIDGACSVHEPDLWTGLDGSTWSKLRTFGFRHMLWDRVTGSSGLRNLSIRYLSGGMTTSELADHVREHRDSFYSSKKSPLVIEASYQAFGALPGFRTAFPAHRIAAIVRDPRTWVTSCLDKGERRGRGDRVHRWGGKRLNPHDVGDELYADRWHAMTLFERLCWDWKTIYDAILQEVDKNPCARLFRYEDLFLSDDHGYTFRDFIKFLTRFEDRTYEFRFDPSVLEQPENVRPRRIASPWREWMSTRAEALSEITGTLMRRFGYGRETEWMALVGD